MSTHPLTPPMPMLGAAFAALPAHQGKAIQQAWEKNLKLHFTEAIDTHADTHALTQCLYIPRAHLPASLHWQDLVGRVTPEIDWEELRHRIDPQNRARLLPAICLALATWAETLQGVEDHLICFLIPFDHAKIMSELGGYPDATPDDDAFYASLGHLTPSQRNTIAQFIEYYFCSYKSHCSGYTKDTQNAASQLLKLWRGS